MSNRTSPAPRLLVFFLCSGLGSTAWAWTTPPGSVHRACADAALSEPRSASFIAYLGLDPRAISGYAQDHEPWDGDWRRHVVFWNIIAPDARGVRYANDLGYVGYSHGRDGRSWPGSFDRSVDVLGAVLHSAADCAVIMGHAPANDWYSNSGYEARFELAGNYRSGTGFLLPALPFNAGWWPRWIYGGTPVNEAHKLYLDTRANFDAWNRLREWDKIFGGGRLNDAAELAVKTGKRWTTAVLVDFLGEIVRKDPTTALSCNQAPGEHITVYAGTRLSFHFAAGGDRQRTALTIGGVTTELGPSNPYARDIAGDTALVSFNVPGRTSATLLASQDFFGPRSAVATVIIDVVNSPVVDGAGGVLVAGAPDAGVASLAAAPEAGGCRTFGFPEGAGLLALLAPLRRRGRRQAPGQAARRSARPGSAPLP